jgi:hypothetical protein
LKGVTEFVAVQVSSTGLKWQIELKITDADER